MSDMKIFEPRATLLNVCPLIKRGEMARRAQITGLRNINVNDFEVELVWGAYEQMAVVQPQDTIELPLSAAKALITTKARDVGIVLLRDDVPEHDLRLLGLERAIQHYTERGSEQLALLSLHYSEDQMKKLRGQFQGLFMNEAREEVLREELDRVLAEGAEAPEPEPEVLEDESGVDHARMVPRSAENPYTAPCGRRDLWPKAQFMSHIKACGHEDCKAEKLRIAEGGSIAA